MQWRANDDGTVDATLTDESEGARCILCGRRGRRLEYELDVGPSLERRICSASEVPPSGAQPLNTTTCGLRDAASRPAWPTAPRQARLIE